MVDYYKQINNKNKSKINIYLFKVQISIFALLPNVPLVSEVGVPNPRTPNANVAPLLRCQVLKARKAPGGATSSTVTMDPGKCTQVIITLVT